MQNAIFQSPIGPIQVQVIRRGANNSRVLFQDGHCELVPTASIVFQQVHVPSPKRMVPWTPLRTFYESLRDHRGDAAEKFRQLRLLLNDRHGPTDADFLGELFCRSQTQVDAYDNRDEPFCEIGNRGASLATPAFANHFVDLIADGTVQFEGVGAFKFVDYEINPLRTTRSCWENGKSATSSGAGGMDMLVVTLDEQQQFPAIAEIKAKTETVGPTFALIQALAYAVELTTASQWIRLGRHYLELLGTVCNDVRTPQLDLLILLQGPVIQNDDLRFACDLAENLLQQDQDRLRNSIRKIHFLDCQIEDGKAVIKNGSAAISPV